jgi:flagellar biosynthetic protein FliR
MQNAPQELRPLLDHAVPFTLVLFRIAGVFIMAPLLTSIMIPQRYKALLSVGIAAAVYPVLADRVAVQPVTDLFGLLPLIVTESLIGLTIGALAAIPLLSLEMSGVLMGQNMGFGLARVYNPEADFDADILGQLLFYIGAGIFVAIGGLELMVGGVLQSFSTVPVGGFAASDVPLDLFVGVISSGFDLAMRVAAPVTGIVFLLIIVFGVIGKTMPQINIMSVGFTVKIVAGLTMLTMAIFTVADAVGIEIEETMGAIERWVDSPTGSH